MLAAGHLPFNWAPPNGYPDSEGYWSGLMLPRWSWAALATRPAGGLRLDLAFLDPRAPVPELVGRIDRWLTAGTLGAESRAAVEGFLAGRGVDEGSLREAVGLVLASPEFQHY
jgi:hypothetical protein